jgi:hypothetical protein
MSRAEHERAIASALVMGDKLLTLFEALGSKAQPTRGVWAAYGLARQTLAGHLDDTRIVNRTLAQLRETAHAIAEKNILAAVRAGEKQAARELAIYDLSDRRQTADDETDKLIDAAMLALDAELDAQLAQVRALAMTGADEVLVLGDASRVGILRASDWVSVVMAWLATVAAAAYSNQIEQTTQNARSNGDGWLKQAVAAIDARTTDCCLRVSGQTVPLKGKFKLNGTPRYADEMDGPPFHRYCRTATALVRAQDANDDLTRRMQEAAQAEIEAQANNSALPYKFPVDAFGGRIDF